VTNIAIHAQKIEDCVKQITGEFDGQRLVGVVDPPRAGLHPSVVLTLRTCRGFSILIKD
jgi:tRNA/tmRNA/rRNA uracil-C5-methylase (TrmA/RlmC/RlmD family)